MIFIWLSIVLLALYVLLLFVYRYGWLIQKSFSYGEDYIPHTRISVVIAARNEADNIETCIQSIIAQNYPADLFELIVVDDFSTDNTAALVESFAAVNVRLVRLQDFVAEHETVISFKKKALETGIAQSSGQLIVTTDADCSVPTGWLRTLAAFYEQGGIEMIVAPVRFSSNYSLLQLFQSLDFMTMQGITVATNRLKLGIMCNGANLAFSRKAYDAVNGYHGFHHLISGDDYLLQLKIKEQFPEGIQYLKSKEVIVDTLPQLSWSSFLQQRIRWASKTGKYNDPKMTSILLLVYLFNCSLLFAFAAVLLEPRYATGFIWIIVLKTLFELIFLYPVASFFGRLRQLILFPVLQPIHILYIFVAGFLSRLGKFHWKQRESIQQQTKKYTTHA